MNDIPCTVSVLTHDSAATLAEALESAKGFAELLVCDGASTDDTLDVARRYGARIIMQSAHFLDAAGRIIDFSGVRNQCLAAATEDWFFFLDSDELLSPELVEELRLAIARGDHDAYFVPRRYVYQGKIVTLTSTYPNYNMRFFKKSAAAGFIKTVHERIELNPGARIGKLTAALLVPAPGTLEEQRRKLDHYIALEVARSPHLTLAAWLRMLGRLTKVSGLYTLRFLRDCFRRGTRLPFAFELERHRYHVRLLAALWRSMRAERVHA